MEKKKKKKKKKSFYYFHILFNLNYSNKFSPYLSSFSIELYSFLFLEVFFFFFWGEETHSGATHKPYTRDDFSHVGGVSFETYLILITVYMAQIYHIWGGVGFWFLVGSAAIRVLSRDQIDLLCSLSIRIKSKELLVSCHSPPPRQTLLPHPSI